MANTPPMGMTGVQPVNLIAALNPDLYAKQLELQRAQMLAGALTGQAMQPSEGTKFTPGPYAQAIRDPWGPLTKLGQAYFANKMWNGIPQQAGDLASQEMGIANQILGQPSGQVTNTPQTGSQENPNGMPSFAAPQTQQPQQQVSQGQENPYLKMAVLSSIYGPAAAQYFAQSNMPTDLQKNITAFAPPGSDLGARTLEKGAYIPPTAVRANTVVLQPGTNTPMLSNPVAPQGTQNVWAPGAVYPTNQPIPGAAPNAAAYTGQTEAAKAIGALQGKFELGKNTQGQPTFLWPGKAPGAPQMPGVQQPQPQQHPSVGAVNAALSAARGSGVGGGGLQTTTQESEQKGVGESLAGLYKQIDADADSATQTDLRLDQLASLGQDFQSGKLAPMQKWMTEWAASTPGLSSLVNSKQLNSATSMEAFEKISTLMATQATRKLSARPSQLEYQSILNANPNIRLLPGGLQKIYVDYKFQNAFDRAKQQARDQWLADPKNSHSLEGFNGFWNKQVANPQLRTQVVQRLSAGPQMPQPAVPAAQQPSPQDIVNELRRRGVVR